MTGHVRFALALLLAFLIGGALWIQGRSPADTPAATEKPSVPHPRGYVCYRASKPPVLDGKLDDDCWKAAPWSEEFGDIEGDRRPAPRFRTRAKMLWDDKCLYIGAELEEPHVWATLTRHDSVIFHDNDFEVFLDPDGDSQLYAELELNALNTTWDLLLPKPYKDGGRALDAWEITGLRTAVHVNGSLNDPRDRDRGWSIEIAWPWQGLKELTTSPVPPRDGDRWRINFSRVEWDSETVGGKYRKIAERKERNWVWSPQGVIDMHRPERWGHLVFSTAAPGSVVFQSDPAQAAREVLHRIYYAQRAYQEKNGRWAKSLDALELADLGHPSLLGPPVLETTASLYEAHVTLRRPGAAPRHWHISSEARVWGD
jgi:hypothetical protein